MNLPGSRIGWWLFLLCFSFNRPPGPHRFAGWVRPNPAVNAATLPANAEILLKTGAAARGGARIDSSGHFTLSVSPFTDSLIDFYCVAPGMDTLFLQTVKPTAANPQILQLFFPCEPDTTGSGDIICPKCRKEDQVYPMVYGDPIVITRHFDTSGKVSYERTTKKPVQTDTPIHAARYYCRRDKINF